MFRALYRNRFRKALRSKKTNYAFLLTCVTLACTVSLTPCYAQQIITDGNTATTLNTNGTVTDVTTTTTKGNNAFNSFSKFNVDAGNTVNLVIPDASDNLINVVNGSQTQINGVLNSIKQGNVGGNIFLANPNGIVIGSQGVVNVGSLTAVTPTQDFTNNFFNGVGDVNDTSVTALINGTVPINVNASIINNGKINAITDVKLDSGSITNTGDIYTDAVFDTDIETGDIVNLNTLDYVDDINNLQLINGNITLKSQGGMVSSSGKFFSGKDFSLSGVGEIWIENKSIIKNNRTITINSDDHIQVRSSNLTSGDIDLVSNNNIVGIYQSDIYSSGNINISGDNYNIRIGDSSNVEAAGSINFNIQFNDISSLIQDNAIVQAGQDINIFSDSRNSMISDSNVAAGNNINLISLTGSSIIQGNSYVNATNELLLEGPEVYINGNIFQPSSSRFKDEPPRITIPTVTADTITFNAAESLKISLSKIIANNILNLNQTKNLTLKPELIQTQNLNSDFLHQNAPLNINLDVDGYLQIGDLDNIWIAGQQFNTTEINITSDAYIISGIPYSNSSAGLSGNISTLGDINVNTGFVNISEDAFINANDIVLDPLHNLHINGGSINANAHITINKGQPSFPPNGLNLKPQSITAKTLSSNFLQENGPLEFNSKNLDYLTIGNLNNIVIDGNPFTPSQINIIDTRLTVWLEGNIATSGDLNLIISNLTISPGTNITANNILISPSNALRIQGGNFNASNNFKINANSNIQFMPESINTTSFSSNFIAQNAPLELVGSIENLYFANLDNININGNPLNPTNIILDSSSKVGLGGKISTSGNIELSGKVVEIMEGSDIYSGSNLILDSSDFLYVYGGHLEADNNITINRGTNDHSLIFKPDSIKANSLTSDFLPSQPNSTLTISGIRSLELGNLSDIYVNNNQFVYQDINISAPGHIQISGDFSSLNDINITCGGVYFKDNTILNAQNNIIINPDSELMLRGGEYYAGNQLTINSGDINRYGLGFTPDRIEALALQSDFLENYTPINLISTRTNSEAAITLGNLHQIIINNETFKPSEINIDTTFDVKLTGGLNVTGSININSDELVIVDNTANIVSGNDINISSRFKNQIDGNISSEKDISFTSNYETSIDGTITANSTMSNSYLLINANGTIDPSSNMEATIASNIINVADFGGSSGLGSTINITATTVTGTGTLEAKGDSSDITITNNSANHLTLNDLTASSDGQVIINNTPVTSYGDLNIITGGSTELGNIDINNNTTSNVIVAGNMQGNDIDILSLGNLEIDGSLTAGNNILLTSNNFDIAPTANVSAYNEVVFSRATPGGIIIGYTGLLTPAELDRVYGNIVIGNHIKTNNNSSFVKVYSGIDKINGDLTISSNNIFLRGNIQNEGDIVLDGMVDFDRSIIQSDQNIVINDLVNLTGTIIAQKKLTLNRNNDYWYILYPQSIEASELESNFLTQNGSLNIVNDDNFVANEIVVGNLDNIIIGGEPLNIKDLNVTWIENSSSWGDHVYLLGNITVDGNININNFRKIHLIGNIRAGNNIYLTSDNILFDETANITAGNLLQITTLNNISKSGTPLTASNLNITANNINNYLPLNVLNTTNINTIGNCLISGATGVLTANTGGVFFYNDPLASSMNINTGGQVNIDNGFVSGNVTITTTAPGIDGPAEIMLGHLNDLDIGGNLTATATNGNIYYYGGSVGGNAAFNSGEAYEHRVSTAIGRYRPLDIAGNLNVTSAGHMSFMEGSVGGDTTINAAKMAGLFDVDLGGDLTANAMAFGYFAGNCAGDINVTAPMGVLLGVGNLLNVSGNVNANSTYGPIIMLDGNVSGGINAETTEVINLGNLNEFVNTNYTYNNTIYNYNNLPVVVTNSDLAIAGNLHLLGEDNIFVDLSRGNLYSDYINTSDGSAFINNNGGDVYINYISAPQTVSVTATGNITINTIDPADIILKSANKGGIIDIGEACFSDNALLSGDYIFGDFFNTSNKPYSFNISGAGGAKATELELQLISGSGIVVNDIKSNKVTLNILTPDTELIIENQDVNYFTINKIDTVNPVETVDIVNPVEAIDTEKLDDHELDDTVNNDYIKDVIRKSTIDNTLSSISNRLNCLFIKNMQQQNDEDFVIEKKLESKLAKINANYDLTDSGLIQLAYELSKIYNNQISKGFTEVEARLAVLKYLRTFNLNLSSVQKQVADRGLNVNLEF